MSTTNGAIGFRALAKEFRNPQANEVETVFRADVLIDEYCQHVPTIIRINGGPLPTQLTGNPFYSLVGYETEIVETIRLGDNSDGSPQFAEDRRLSPGPISKAYFGFFYSIKTIGCENRRNVYPQVAAYYAVACELLADLVENNSRVQLDVPHEMRSVASADVTPKYPDLVEWAKQHTKDGTDQQKLTLDIANGLTNYLKFVSKHFPSDDSTEQNRRWNAFRTSINKKMSNTGFGKTIEKVVNDILLVPTATNATSTQRPAKTNSTRPEKRIRNK